MVKQLRKIELNIVGEPDTSGVWQIKASADLTTGLDDYPDWNPQRKGIPIVLTSSQKTTIKNFVKTVVLPQAEEKK